MLLSRDEKKYWVGYASDEAINWSLIKLLAKSAGSLERSWANSKLLSRLKLKNALKSRLKRLWASLDVAELISRVEKSGVKIVTIVEEHFPKSLINIPDQPFLLFYRGNLNCLSTDLILASVGTRKASRYGLTSTNRLITPLAKNGVVVVSGLAYGIDEASHKACLSAGGRTVAVLGGGVSREVIYPASNRELSEKIIKSGGLLISQYLPWRRPEKRFFVARNRIISGLAKAVLVVEAGEKSGSLITAEFGLEQGKDVFALPGNIDRGNSIGTNSLIKDGAYLVDEADVLAEYFNIVDKITKKINFSSGKEKNIFRYLSKRPARIDEIAKMIDLDASGLSAILSNMEIKGLVKRQGGKYIIK